MFLMMKHLVAVAKDRLIESLNPLLQEDILAVMEFPLSRAQIKKIVAKVTTTTGKDQQVWISHSDPEVGKIFVRKRRTELQSG